MVGHSNSVATSCFCWISPSLLADLAKYSLNLKNLFCFLFFQSVIQNPSSYSYFLCFAFFFFGCFIIVFLFPRMTWSLCLIQWSCKKTHYVATESLAGYCCKNSINIPSHMLKKKYKRNPAHICCEYLAIEIYWHSCLLSIKYVGLSS